MAVRLRLVRMGKKKQPTYRVVAADKRSPRNGKFIEIIGTYEPRREPSIVKIDNERAVHWLQHGAQPSERVEKLLKLSGAWDEFKGNTPGTSGTLLEQPPKAVRPGAATAEEPAAEAKPAKKVAAVKAPKAPKPAESPAVEPKAEGAEQAPAVAEESAAVEEAAPVEQSAEDTAPVEADSSEDPGDTESKKESA